MSSALTPLFRCQFWQPFHIFAVFWLFNSRNKHHRNLNNGLNEAIDLYLNSENKINCATNTKQSIFCNKILKLTHR